MLILFKLRVNTIDYYLKDSDGAENVDSFHVDLLCFWKVSCEDEDIISRQRNPNWQLSPIALITHQYTGVTLYCQYQHKTGNITEYWANINELSTLIKHFIGCSQILLSLELRLCNSYQIFQKCCNSCHFVCMMWQCLHCYSKHLVDCQDSTEDRRWET